MSNFIHYREYIGSVEFSEEDEVFHGKLIGMKKASISYEGDNVTSFIKDFHDAVDEYLEHCEENGIQPEKPFKGSFNIRIRPELHKKAALAASDKGMSLNSLVEESIQQYLSK